ncbi:helix-turn-helix domain-containing protein [Pseudomonadota bacterium]
MFMKLNPLISKIERELKQRYWTKTEFCERLGVSSQTYNNWRTRDVPNRRIADIAEIFDWDLSDLIRKPLGIKDANGNYEELSLEAREVGKRWQSLPRNLQMHLVEVLDSTERLLNTEKK